ncbi:unnamed protein product, partial [Schistosoma margrebowiei]
MSPSQERVDNVISFASQLASTVGLSAPNTTLDHKLRWYLLLQSLSRLIGSPLGYISIRRLRIFDPYVLYSLLELIDLLAQNTLIQKDFRITEQIHNKRLNPDGLYGSVSCKLEKLRNLYSHQKSSPILLQESQNNFESRSHDNMESKLQNMDRTTESSSARLAYLQEKLKTCLPSILLDENSSENDGASTLTRSNSFRTQQLKRPSSDNCNCSCKSVLKLHAKPLVDTLHIYANKHSTVPHLVSSTEGNEDLSNQSFYKLLNGFPKIDLDEHEERILRKKASRNALVGWESHGSRIIKASFKTKKEGILMNIIQCYAPTNDSNDDIKDQFYERLQSVIEKCPRKDLTILMGDLNAKVGIDNTGYEDIMGRHGLG